MSMQILFLFSYCYRLPSLGETQRRQSKLLGCTEHDIPSHKASLTVQQRMRCSLGKSNDKEHTTFSFAF
jgi:hypothetical protein